MMKSSNIKLHNFNINKWMHCTDLGKMRFSQIFYCTCKNKHDTKLLELWIIIVVKISMVDSKALVCSKKLLALSAHAEILSIVRSQFFSSLALALSNKRALLNFALIFKRFLEVFVHEIIPFFPSLAVISKYTFKAKNQLRFKDILGKIFEFYT